MEFCKNCEALMRINTVNGKISYVCCCGNQHEASNDQSCMFEEYFETDESAAQHEVLMSNSPFDKAANIVLQKCPNCPRNYMTRILVSTSMMIMFTCKCSYRATLQQYKVEIAEIAEK